MATKRKRPARKTTRKTRRTPPRAANGRFKKRR